MSRTITAMFDSRSEAEAARDQLTRSNIHADNVRIVDQSSASSGGTGGGSNADGGFWSSLKDAFMPDEDRYAYQEGISRGGYLLYANVDENQADEACRILDTTGSIDFDQRQEEWRSNGWSGYNAEQHGRTQGLGRTQTAAGSREVEEEHIPIVEEQLRVGKREVERGGARVRSYIQETPVHEQVNLREEHVSVERRPVDRTLERGELDRAGDMLQERSIEMTERAEEAVVGKEARVREELVVKKTATERTEQIDDTVRHTEVEVDEGLRSGGGGSDRGALFGSSGGTGTTGGSDTTGTGGGTGLGSTGTDRESVASQGTYANRDGGRP